MSKVAEQLRNARAAQNLTIEKLAEVTKIRGDHLRALEEGNYDMFVAPVYIRGFVRTYSTLLKLDVPQVMADLDAELGQTRKFAEPPPLSAQPRGVVDAIMLQLSKIDWRKGATGLVLAVVMVVAISAYLIYKKVKTSDPLSGLKPGVYQPTQAVSGDTLPLPAPASKK
jgi:cytoskeletal protein RodZ